MWNSRVSININIFLSISFFLFPLSLFSLKKKDFELESLLSKATTVSTTEYDIWGEVLEWKCKRAILSAQQKHSLWPSFETNLHRAKVSRTDSLINTSLDIHARRYRRSSSNLRLTTGRFETELRIKAAKANIGNVEREPIGSVPGNFPDRVGKKVTSRGEWNFLYVYQRKNSLVICFLC